MFETEYRIIENLENAIEETKKFTEHLPEWYDKNIDALNRCIEISNEVLKK